MEPTAPPHEASADHVFRGHRLDTHPPSGAAAPTSTNPNIGEATQLPKLTLQGNAHKRDVAPTPSSPAPASRNLGFHPKRPSQTRRKRKQRSTTMPPWRYTTPIGAAIIGTNPRSWKNIVSKCLSSHRNLSIRHCSHFRRLTQPLCILSKFEFL
jgi:hypothetical protein